VVPFHLSIVPADAQHRSGQYFQLSGHDLLFPERIWANPLPYSFVSGFSPCTFQASFFNPPEFLIMFNCPINEYSRNFQWF
jgi:hypothetical protein